jgi:lipoate-protein ligase A
VKKRTKFAAGAGAALAAVGAGAAVGATQKSPSEESAAIVDDAAKQLGVTPEKLSGALRQAFENHIDQAVEDGRLSEETAERLKEGLEAGELPLVGAPVLKGRGPHGHRLLRFGLQTAATYLGVTEAELREALRDGKSLADVAEAEGKSVDGLVDALVKEQTARLDEGVEDGRLTKAKRDEILEELRERVERMVQAEPMRALRGPHFGPGHRMEPAPGDA